MRRGIRVTQLIRSDYPLSMQVDRTAGELILSELVQKGLDVRVGVTAEAFCGGGRVESARLSDGSELGCDMVVIGKGVLPALSFVPRDRIDVDLGILVDAHMETSVPGIYAAGDAAEFFDIARKTRWVNAIWPEAVIQGRTAGMNMAGRPVALRGSLSRNVIRIFDMDILTGGWVDPPESEGCRVIRRIDRRSGTYRKLVLDGDRLAGVVMVNHIEQGGLLISLIQRQAPLGFPAEKLLSAGLNYRQLLN
jgi:NAD(P)H-nitrite reductase large subunit